MRQIIVEKKGHDWGADGVASGDTQEAAAEAARAYARERATDAEPISVQVRHEDGTLGEERTYPRSADPASSPG